MIPRLAWDGCQAELSRFECAFEGPDAEENLDWIRRYSWDWSRTSPDDPRLILFVDDVTAHLIAVAAHDQRERNVREFWVFAMSTEFENQRRAGDCFRTAMEDAGQFCPSGFATWLTHPQNTNAVGFFEHMGGEYTQPPEDKPLLRFKFDL